MAKNDCEATAFPRVPNENAKKSDLGKYAATAGIAGAFGAAAPFLMGMHNASSATPSPGIGETVVPDEAALASSTSDSMSFSEAFAAARAEVGPGGIFHWHGETYGTYYAEEWENLSAEGREEFAQHVADTVTDHPAPAYHGPAGQAHTAQQATGDNHEVVNHANAEVIAPEPDPEPVPEPDPNGDVEVISVSHDDESGMNVAELSVDGTQVGLLDVDGDRTFDVLAADINEDGTITNSEMVDITDQGISVASLGGYTDGPDNEIIEGEPLVDDDLLACGDSLADDLI